MKETRLGYSEAVVMLLVGILVEIDRSVAIGALHSTICGSGCNPTSHFALYSQFSNVQNRFG